MLVLILLLPTVMSIGITPPEMNLQYEPGRSKEVTIEVRNNEHRSMEAQIVVMGELKDAITLSKDTLSFDEAEAKKTFTYTIDMPEDVERPGVHSATIKVKEQARRDGEGNLRPALEVVSEVFCHVPYPDTYVEGTLNVRDVRTGETVTFFNSIYNLGDKDLSEVRVTLDILDSDGTTVKTLESDSRPLTARKMGELIIKHPTAGMRPGTYTVEATVHYDGKQATYKGRFTIEEFLINLESINTGEYSRGEIAKLYMLVQNIGNRMVKDFYSKILIKKDGSLVDSVKSFNIDLDPDDVKETTAYWDTKDIPMGVYYGEMRMQYEDKTRVENLSLKLEEDKITVNVITGHAIRESPGSVGNEGSNPMQFVYLFLGLLVLVNIIVVILLRRKSGGKG